MNRKTILIVVTILAVGLSSAYAGNENRTGTAGAQELLIPVGSRGAAMGSAVVATAAGVDALYWNPSGLAKMTGTTEVMFMHLPYIADIDVNYAAIGTTIEDFGSLALSVKIVDVGEWEETTEASPSGTGRVFNPTLTVIGLTYAKPLTSSVNFGVTGHIVQEDIFEVSATGFAFDFGFTYDTRYRGLSLGFALKNWGPNMEFGGEGFDRTTADDRRPKQSANAGLELPTSINLGMAYNFLSDGLNSASISGNFRGNNQSQDNFQGGAEYSYDDRYFLRAGYNYAKQDGYLYGASLGGGVVLPMGTTTLTLEYSWTETEVFNNNQFFTVKFGF